MCKQELHPDAIHLPHPLPQPTDPYYHSHDPTLHFPITGMLPSYPYITTHSSDHYSLQPYQPTDPTNSALSPIVSHEYPNEYLIKSAKKIDYKKKKKEGKKKRNTDYSLITRKISGPIIK
jgi:hypothetical protein